MTSQLDGTIQGWPGFIVAGWALGAFLVVNLKFRVPIDDYEALRDPKDSPIVTTWNRTDRKKWTDEAVDFRIRQGRAAFLAFLSTVLMYFVIDYFA